MQEQLISLLAARRGHFRLESGHHGDLWMDLEVLCLRPQRISPFAVELAKRLSAYKVEAVCGPLVEGAFVGLMVAAELDVEFCYSEPLAPEQSETLYPVKYRIPGALRDKIRGKVVAIVNDVINAGSAVGGTFMDLKACGATPVAIGTLLALGTWVSNFAANQKIKLEAIASLPNVYWTPAECPLCAAGAPISEPRGRALP